MNFARRLETRRAAALQAIDRHGLSLRKSPGGVFHVTGDGVHVQVRDLADADVADAVRAAEIARKSEWGRR